MAEADEPPRILVADDEEGVRQLAIELLTQRGATVIAVNDGEAAVQAASTSVFDLCIMDIDMPRLDGLAACRLLRTLPLTAALPVMFLTGSTDRKSVDAAYQAGGTDFMVKPINIGLLWHRANIHIQSYRMKQETQRLTETIEGLEQCRRIEEPGGERPCSMPAPDDKP